MITVTVKTLMQTQIPHCCRYSDSLHRTELTVLPAVTVPIIPVIIPVATIPIIPVIIPVVTTPTTPVIIPVVTTQAVMTGGDNTGDDDGGDTGDDTGGDGDPVEYY